MANLKTFSGFPVQNLSSDSTSVGQIYYNTASGTFKAVKEGGATIWACFNVHKRITYLQCVPKCKSEFPVDISMSNNRLRAREFIS